MAELFSDIAALIQKDFPGFKLQVDEGWNSTIVNHRIHIRSALCDSLVSSGESNVHQWSDLNRRPDPTHFSVSISHCPVAGGFVQIPRPFKVGFDLEDLSRKLEKAITRIASGDELKDAPSPAALWVAKESVLKATDLLLVRDARVNSWKTLGISSWNFSYGETGLGFVHHNSRLIMGLFIFQP